MGPCTVFCILLLPVLWILYALYPALRTKWASVQNLNEKYACQWVMVTGAAGGIGQSICDDLARQGLNVLAVGRNQEKLDELCSRLQTSHRILAEPVIADFSQTDNYTSPPYIEALESACAGKDVGILVLNAGLAQVGSVLAPNARALAAIAQINAVSQVYVVEWFMRRLVAHGRVTSAVVSISSVAAFTPTPLASTYSASKAFVSRFMDGVRPEATAAGIDLLTVHPGPVRTPFYDCLDDQTAKRGMWLVNMWATGPEAVSQAILRSVGRVNNIPQGFVGVWGELAMRVVGTGTVAWIMDRVGLGLIARKERALYVDKFAKRAD
ncbi:Glucose/ribitol dehydrogenase [Carpediemonas membranifera]|uniref:Glucose/ribitol dehydrogenase n=1 Tax=Carpediemonas membranifera TaxID=201153 RepID=A0A8J6AP51_9EUKA|nr:Glucose/ribitol dehydrogenase [Carpediemonas membranifera]|eukprot:KAG9389521.1 Glucose/ribitol dehydrogenase [Carpediemonas membranifera]